MKTVEAPTVATRTGVSRLDGWTLAPVLAVALVLRLPGLVSTGLWRDDAWTALAARVPLGSAMQMSTTTPGFTLLERVWIGFVPGSSLWAQLLPLAAGLAGVVAVYALARFFRLPPWACVAVAAAVAVAPVCVEYSTHVKQYSTDLLLGCLLLWLCERTRRALDARSALVFAGVCAAAILLSASALPVVAGAWCALLLEVPSHGREARRAVFQGAAVVAAFGLVLRALVLNHLPTVLHRYWAHQGAFIDTASVHALIDSSIHTVRAMAAGLSPLAGGVDAFGFLHWTTRTASITTLLIVVLVAVGVTSGRHARASALALAVAFAASVAGVIPLGTGRTDEALYPAILLLAALGADRLAHAVSRYLRAAGARPGLRLMLAGAVLGAVLLAELVAGGKAPVSYPAVDVRALAAHLAELREPGDRVLIEPSTRYPWALYEEKHVHVVFGGSWGTGFTVASDDPNVFIAPSESWEQRSTPDAWVDRLSGARRVWYVVTGAPGRIDVVYAALRAHGWKPATPVQTTGGYIVLMTR